MRKWPGYLQNPDSRQLVDALAANPRMVHRMHIAPPRRVRRFACKISDFAWPEFRVRGDRMNRRRRRARQTQQAQAAAE